MPNNPIIANQDEVEGVAKSIYDELQKHTIARGMSNWGLKILSSDKHFDWFFPNLKLNQGTVINYYPARNLQAGDQKCIFYDSNLVNALLKNIQYRDVYLQVTRKYFFEAGLIGLNDKQVSDCPDPSQIKYQNIQGYIVRLNKIIQSYRILMYFAQKLYEQEKASEIKTFLDDLKKTYQCFYSAITSASKKYNEIFNQSDGITKISQCFENNIDKMNFVSDSKKNSQLQRYTKNRDIAQGVYCNSEKSANPIFPELYNPPHFVIEQQIHLERNLEPRSINNQGQSIIATGTILKPYHPDSLLNQRYKDQKRGVDFTVFDDFKDAGKINIERINQVMVDNLLEASSSLNLTKDDVNQAIMIARIAGGFSNIFSKNGEINIAQFDKESRVNLQACLNQINIDDISINQKLKQFQKFSALFQKLNSDCGIYSGRKDGKMVGLRLTFVNLMVQTEFLKGDFFDGNGMVNANTKAKIKLADSKQKHEDWKSQNQSFKDYVQSQQRVRKARTVGLGR